MKIKVGGMVLRMVTSEMDEFGRFDEEKNAIFIRAGMEPAMVYRTLLHEVLHAIWAEYDLPKEPIEETSVRRLESGLSGFFMDNPKLATAMVKEIIKSGQDRG